jgi:hypothetical protein
MDYDLWPLPGNNRAAITDRGLVNGFGIFGAPGTGKTHLVMHILWGLLNSVQPRPDEKFGGLILDPKAGLFEDFMSLWARLGAHRAGDLVVIQPDFLNYLDRQKSREPRNGKPPHVVHEFEALGAQASAHPTGLNVIDCSLSPSELGKMLVLAAQSAGVSAKDPFWFLAWSNLFSAALTLLEYTEDCVPTIPVLLDHILLPDRLRGKPVPDIRKSGGSRCERGIEVLARRVREAEKEMVASAHRYLRVPEDQISTDLRAAATQIESFFQCEYVHTIEAFILGAFGGFLQHKFKCFSQGSRRTSVKYKERPSPSLYDQIIEDGKVVFVCIGPENPTMGKVLCTLIKCLFQQSVMSRLERYNSGKLGNFTRPVFIACDEFAEIASEVPGQPMGDGRFFSLARQNGCMGILATQSIHTLENSSLEKSWKSIFSNLAAKIFMGAADNETAEQACHLSGELDWLMTSNTEAFGKERSFSRQRSIQQRSELTPYILTHKLQQGQGVAIGSLDGRKTQPALRFFQVPADIFDVPSEALGSGVATTEP